MSLQLMAAPQSGNVDHWQTEDIIVLQGDDELKVELSPNPVKSVLRIRVTGPSDGISSYAIYSVTGKKILETKASKLQNIDVSSLKSGLYFLKVKTDSDKQKTMRFVKM